ncbi:MAG: phage tail tape measure protein [Christensenellales bacterium]
MALGTAAVKSSIDFESSFTSVRKTVNATEAQFDQLAATSKKMSTEVAAGTDEINGVMAGGGELGVATEHLSDFTRVMIDLGNSCEDLNASNAATTIAQFANIMGTSQSQLRDIGSTLVDLGNNFATAEKPIMEMAHRMAGAGKQVV